MSGSSVALIGGMATVVAALIGYFGARLTRQTQREEATDKRWQAMLERQAKDFDLLLKPLHDRIDDLEEKVTILEAELKTERGRLRSALRFIRVLLGFIDRHVPSEHPPTIPDELVDDL